MTAAQASTTFRDPDGSLTLEGDFALRSIHPCARRSVLEFIASPFYQRMQKRGDIVAATVDDSPASLRLIHPRIPVPSYPWEWTPSQWLAAAELTLDLCEEGLAEGWILKDATPLNILFVGPRPVLVDVLSFERHDPTFTIWIAYAQYARTFLVPLIMYRLLRWPLSLSLFQRDGYVPADIYPMLNWRQRLSRAAFWSITVPAWLQAFKRPNTHASKASAHSSDSEFVLSVLQNRLHALRRRTRRAASVALSSSSWLEYAESRAHYTPDQAAQKREWVTQIMQDFHPATVLDVGANAGEFSAIAAVAGAQVVALERDAAAAEQLFRLSRDRRLSIQTIQADLARPTPAAGWEHAETAALLPRLEDRFDLVLMLAVIHHLLLLEQVPLSRIVALCSRLTRRYLAIEWVPVHDPMFQEMMRGRDDLYGLITEQDLLQACDGSFRLLRQRALDNGRTLFLFEKR